MKGNENEKNESKTSRLLKLLLKLAITALCFWYVGQKIDFSEAFHSLKTANWLLLAFSVLLYILSKIVAAFRLNVYFKNIGLTLSQLTNLKLYWLGMFYNLFLPGSISGDAYKVVLLNKKRGAPYKQTSAAVLLDRFSGLLGLGAILAVFGFFVLPQEWHMAAVAGGLCVSLLAFHWIVSRFFTDFLPGFWKTLLLGTLVQLIQVGGVYLILLALRLNSHYSDWIFLFLFASVVSVLPLSLGGGLGTREVVFAEGSLFFALDPHLGVTISLLFYLTSVVGAVAGAYFIFRDPFNGTSRRESMTANREN